MKTKIQDYREIFDSINFVDSSLFSLCLNIFNFRMVLDVLPLNDAIEERLGGKFELVSFEFRRISNFSLSFDRGVFPKPFLSDGSVAASEIANFDFERIKLNPVGKTIHTDRTDTYCDPMDIYEIDFYFDCGKLSFRFVELFISGYEA